MKYFVYPLSGMRKEAAAWKELWRTVGFPIVKKLFDTRVSKAGKDFANMIGRNVTATGLKETNSEYRDRLLSAVKKKNK